MTKKTLAKKIKNFLKPSESEEESPDLAAAIAKLAERMEALERKTDAVLGRLSSLPSEIRNASQSFSRPQSRPIPTPQRPGSSPQAFSRVPSAVPPVLTQPSAAGAIAPAAPIRAGRRDRLLFKAVCADCRKDCDVPVKPTEGRPVYCKPCFALRKAEKTLPAKNAANSAPLPHRVSEVPSGNDAPLIPERSLGHVPPQVHNLARRSAVAYMAKKAGHFPSPQASQPQTSAAVGSSSSVPVAKSTSRSRPVRNERSKPKKRGTR